jgi:hypothetical protein
MELDKQPIGTEVWDARRNRRQKLPSSAIGSFASAGGTKRKSRGSLEVAGMCSISMLIPSFNIFVNHKRIHLRGVPLVITELLSQNTLPLLPRCRSRPSHLRLPLLKAAMKRRNGELASHLAHSSSRGLVHTLLTSSIRTRRTSERYTAGLDFT